jgi:two-component system KDP operon response regulator KdpE
MQERREPPVAALTEPIERVVIVHSSAAPESAWHVAHQLGAVPIEVALVDVSKTAVGTIAEHDPDAIVVAHAVHTFDLHRLCRDIRQSVDRPMVVVASPAPADDLVVETLESGADDVVAAGVATHVLVARLRAATRGRPRPEPEPPGPIVVGDVAIDPVGHAVRIGGEVAAVRPIHFQLLLVLARHAGAIVGPEQMLREVWGAASGAVDHRRIRIAISRLRQTLGSGPLRPVIETVASFGYRLIVPMP